jgi:hypothetical protein
MKMLNRGAVSVKPPEPAVCNVPPQNSSPDNAAVTTYERPVTVLHSLAASDDESPVAVQVVVNTVQAPPVFVNARNSETVVGLPPKSFKAALKASKLPVTRVRGLGDVVEREAFCRWLASQAQLPAQKTIAPRDAADEALSRAGFRRAR